MQEFYLGFRFVIGTRKNPLLNSVIYYNLYTNDFAFKSLRLYM